MTWRPDSIQQQFVLDAVYVFHEIGNCSVFVRKLKQEQPNS